MRKSISNFHGPTTWRRRQRCGGCLRPGTGVNVTPTACKLESAEATVKFVLKMRMSSPAFCWRTPMSSGAVCAGLQNGSAFRSDTCSGRSNSRACALKICFYRRPPAPGIDPNFIHNLLILFVIITVAPSQKEVIREKGMHVPPAFVS